jgi:hypothetical protein
MIAFLSCLVLNKNKKKKKRFLGEKSTTFYYIIKLETASENRYTGSFYRKIISPIFFDRTPLHLKVCWPNAIWKDNLTERR